MRLNKSRIVFWAFVLFTAFWFIQIVRVFDYTTNSESDLPRINREKFVGNIKKELQIVQPPLRQRNKLDTKSTIPKFAIPNNELRNVLKRKGWDDQDSDGHLNLNAGQGRPWQQFHRDISPDALYGEGALYMADLLRDLATLPIVNASMFRGGSQVKLDFRLADGNRAIVKPMRSPRTLVYKYDNNEPFWLDLERHNAEIAAFHLDRILGFRRVCPCAGRLINLTHEILHKSTDKELLSTFFTKDGNLCFIGKCAPWFCNEDHPICARGEMLEVSLCQFLPSYRGHVSVLEYEYPWSQGKKESKVWKKDNLCTEFLQDPEWLQGRFLLDLVEQGIFDFFIHNYDRHHYEILRKYGKRSSVIFLDNGKGFGNPHTDDITFLVPIYQCCKVRRSTFEHFKTLTQPDSKLSDLLRSAMLDDPLAPVLTEDHLLSMDRRLGLILSTIDECMQQHGENYVLVEGLDI